jgi:RNA polymerase sigma-70 factor (ECF subfamily)
MDLTLPPGRATQLVADSRRAPTRNATAANEDAQEGVHATVIGRHSEKPDSELFCELVRPHLQSLRNVLRCLSRNDSEIDDILQQTLLQAFCNFHQLRSVNLLRPWLFKIAVNEMRRMWRALSREHLVPSIDEPTRDDKRSLGLRDLVDCHATPSEELERREMAVLLQNQLKQLPPRSREVLLLHGVEDLTIEEISQKLNMTKTDVRNTIGRARFTLRQSLSAYPVR